MSLAVPSASVPHDVSARENPRIDVSVILPTYCEAENLPALIPRIADSLTGAGISCEVLVVDDDSPDGTADIVRELGSRYPTRVEVRRGERGLASAVLKGFELAAGKVVVVMDADGSHPPERLPAMVQPILDGQADITVGSRWVKGGGLDGWPWHRVLISRVAGSLSMGLTPLRDPTSGFLAMNRGGLQGLELSPVGWKIVLEIVVKSRGARVKEVPIRFSDRSQGKSKLSAKVQWQYLRHLTRLYLYRFPSLLQLWRFCLVGASGMLVDMGAVIALKETIGIDTRLASLVGFSAALTTNYLFNSRWTFAGTGGASLRGYLAFVGTSAVGLVVRLIIVHLLVVAGFDVGLGYIAINFAGIVGGTLANFLGARRFAFRGHPVPPRE